MSFFTLLPMAFVMIAGPQFLTAIFLATSESWRTTSAAFLVGATLAIAVVVTLAFSLATAADHHGASHHTLDLSVLGLLLAAMTHTFLSRKTAHTPKWMGKLGSATPRTAFTLGVLLLGLFPTDILTSVSIGIYLRAHGDPLWHALGFIGLTVLFLALPVLLLLALGARATKLLPEIRDWMTTNAWVVNEIVLAFFVALVISDLAG